MSSDAGVLAGAAVRSRAGRRPARWAVRAAHLAALTTLPSCLWRLGLAAGLPLGYAPEWLASNAGTLTDRAYLVALSLITEGLALLTSGWSGRGARSCRGGCRSSAAGASRRSRPSSRPRSARSP